MIRVFIPAPDEHADYESALGAWQEVNRAVNRVTGSNWEGTGVTPDVAVPEAEARDVAYGKALRHVLAQDDVPPPVKHEACQALSRLESGKA